MKFIYFVYFESEKISDDFTQHLDDFLDYIREEEERFLKMTKYTNNYCIYLETLLKILNCYVKNYVNSN